MKDIFYLFFFHFSWIASAISFNSIIIFRTTNIKALSAPYESFLMKSIENDETALLT